MDYIHAVLELLARWFLFDMNVFTKWWLYAPLFIPFMIYLCFFLIKWTVITLPIWLPLSKIFGSRNR